MTDTNCSHVMHLHIVYNSKITIVFSCQYFFTVSNTPDIDHQLFCYKLSLTTNSPLEYTHIYGVIPLYVLLYVELYVHTSVHTLRHYIIAQYASSTTS